MSIRSALARVSGRTTVLASVDRLNNTGKVWNGTTQRNRSEYDQYMNSGVTDANGRIVFNLTTDGTASGPAVFSAIHSVDAICGSNSTNFSLLPYFFVETVSANNKQITIRGIAQKAFAPSGVVGSITVTGLPA